MDVGKPQCGTDPRRGEKEASLQKQKSVESSKTSKGEAPRHIKQPHSKQARNTKWQPQSAGVPNWIIRGQHGVGNTGRPRCTRHGRGIGNSREKSRDRVVRKRAWFAMVGQDGRPLCRGPCVWAMRPGRGQSPKANQLMYHDVENAVLFSGIVSMDASRPMTPRHQDLRSQKSCRWRCLLPHPGSPRAQSDTSNGVWTRFSTSEQIVDSALSCAAHESSPAWSPTAAGVPWHPNEGPVRPALRIPHGVWA